MLEVHDRELSSMLSAPVWAERFRSDDLDEVRAVIGRMDGEHSRVAHSPGPLGYQIAWLRGQTVSLAWARVALPTTLRGELPNVLLHLAIPPGSRYRFGRREFQVRSHEIQFVADRWEFTRQSPPGTTFAISLNKDALLTEIAARGAGRPGTPLLMTRLLQIDAGTRTRLDALVAALLEARAPGASLQSTRHAEAALLSAVADLLIGRAAVVGTRRTTAARAADLESWIDANLERPITAGQLCRIAGVSKRGLEKIFESRRGMSPMRFVTERRLAAAHRLLSSAGSADDVTRVALGLGFNHAGRFSALYCQTYGELPSQTLKRTLRQRSGGVA